MITIWWILLFFLHEKIVAAFLCRSGFVEFLKSLLWVVLTEDVSSDWFIEWLITKWLRLIWVLVEGRPIGVVCHVMRGMHVMKSRNRYYEQLICLFYDYIPLCLWCIYWSIYILVYLYIGLFIYWSIYILVYLYFGLVEHGPVVWCLPDFSKSRIDPC